MQQQGMYRECPHCREQMRRDASVCPHCRRESAAWQLHEGRWWVETDGKWFYLDENANQWVASEQRQPVAASPEPTSSQPAAVLRKKGLWRGRSKWEKGAWVVLALIVIGVVAAAVSSNNDSSSSSAGGGGGAPVASASSSDEITGRVTGVFHRDCLLCGDLKRFVKTSNVWCGWRNDALVVHVTMKNTSVEHVTVNEGGKAIVGTVTHGGAGGSEKRQTTS